MNRDGAGIAPSGAPHGLRLPQRASFCSPTVASFEAQFSAQACVGVHDDTEAHAHPSHLSLK